MVLEKTLESPLDCKEIQPVHPKGNQFWIVLGRTDAEAETPVLWPPDTKRWLTGKDPDAGKDWRREEKGLTEDEMVGWHHWLDGHELEQAPGVGDGQGSLPCCHPWGCRELDTTKQLNWITFKTFWNCLLLVHGACFREFLAHVCRRKQAHKIYVKANLGLPWWLGGKEPACQCGRHWFDPWSGKIPHALEQLSMRATIVEPVF